MRRRTAAAYIGFLSLAAIAAWNHFATAGIEDPPVCGPFAAGMVDPVPATASMGAGLNYGTGFESAEGFPLGYISNTPGVHPAGCGGPAFPCWGHTTSADASLITPTIESIHPHTGLQHLRLIHDPTTRTNQPGFGLGVDARYPRAADLSVRPVAPTTTSLEMAISAPGGQDFRVQPQSNSQGCIQGSALFFYTGEIYILDDLCGTVALGFQPTGFQWDTTGAYQNFTWSNNPCNDTLHYAYGGQLIYSSCIVFGTTLEQFLVFGDNYPGSSMDVDNVVLESLDSCPCQCGNGIIQTPCETCEPGVGGCNPGHTCTDCQCSRTCTLDAPCTLENGDNGPFYGPFDASFGGIFTYEAPAGVDAVSVELCGSTGADQRILYWGSCTDANDPGSSNDDCCNPNDAACGSFGVGSDPSASCYNDVHSPNWESCTCHDNPLPDDNCYLLQIRPPSGAGQIHVEVNKKAICGQGHLGACCDTNGADTGCTDNVLSGACSGADQVWTENGKCAEIGCACIPDCTGANCGDDGCGGSCGTCDDGIACTIDVCESDFSCSFTPNHALCVNSTVCDGYEFCSHETGCVAGNPLVCDDGEFCNGTETCNPSSGCAAGANPCPDNTTCNEETDACDPNSIPTVNEWGLVALTLMLLIGAKVYFARRQLA